MLRLVLVLVIVMAGCVRNVEPDPTAASCNGTRYVVVSNDWSRPVEVYAYPGVGRAMRIGTVLSNSKEEFQLPKRGSAVLRSENSAGQRITLRTEHAESSGIPVALAYLCR